MNYIKKKRVRYNLFMYFIILPTFLSKSYAGSCEIWPYICFPSSCDISLEYAMDTKQKESISDRLNDFNGIVKANTKQTKNQTKIINKEILAYTRLLERIQKEALMLKEAGHISQQISESTILDESTKIIQKGKK